MREQDHTLYRSAHCGKQHHHNRQIPVDDLEQLVQKQFQRDATQQVEDLDRETQAIHQLVRRDVASSRRGIAAHDQLVTNAELRVRTADDDDQVQDAGNSRECARRYFRTRLAQCYRSHFSCSNSRSSPGWHSSASQIASSVEKRIARALPVLRMDRLASVIPTLSESSVRVIRRA